MEIPENMVATATVLEKGIEDEEKGWWKLVLDVPEINKNYSTSCSRVTTELAGLLKIRGTYRVQLQRQSLRKSKDGTVKSGAYYSDYWWGLVGLAPEGATTEALPQPSDLKAPPWTAPAAPTTAKKPTIGDPQRASIEAQTCLKAAVELQVAFLGTGGLYTAPAFLDLVKDMAMGLAAAREVLGSAPGYSLAQSPSAISADDQKPIVPSHDTELENKA